MILVLFIALVLIGASVALALRAALVQSARGRQTLEHIGAYGFNAEAARGPARLRTRELLSRLATTMGSLYSQYASEERERQTRDLLRSAGLYRMRAATFFGYRILATVGLALFFLWLLSLAGANALAVFFIVFVQVAKGLRQNDPTQLELMRSYAASPRQVLNKVRLPNTMPYLFTGVRTAVPIAVIILFIGIPID